MGSNYKDTKVAVLGLGMEGKDAVNYLAKQGAKITILDRKEKKDLDTTGININRLKFICGADYLTKGLSGFDMIVRSPGVYRNIPEIIEAEKKSVQVTSDVKIFFENCPAKIIGVTGTKGKGTTSTLIYEILKAGGYDVYLVGNIGKPCLEILPVLTKNSWVVMELSSFQLFDLTISPHIAVVLNITVDHLDWHKSRKEYVEAKTNIVKHQKGSDFAVINYDYQTPKSFDKMTVGKVRYFSRKKRVAGCFVEKDKITLTVNNRSTIIGDTRDLLLRGEHNWENITAAICAAYSAGVKLDAIKKVVFSFKGLEHRLELVKTVDGITFFNDSFATGPQPTTAAIEAFTEPETLILGGYDKGLDYTELGQTISKRKNVAAVILIGDVTQKIKEALILAKYKGVLLELGKPPMKEIVEIAYKNTPQGGVVLLSPAAASFDMFKSYKDRGNQFKEAVFALK